MSYQDPFHRYSGKPPRRASGQVDPYRQQQPTLEDYYQLFQAHQALKKEQAELTKEVEIGQEALRQQTQKAMEIKAALDTAQQQVFQLQDELNAARAGSEWEERYQQLQAETENYRRRLEQRLQSDVQRARNQILEDMLPLADHLEMALQHMDRAVDAENDLSIGENFRQNVQATLHAFLDTMRKYGVQSLSPLGDLFDPQKHEAVGYVVDPDVAAEHVSAVVRTGYLVDDQLLRPARVLVSSGML